MPPEWTPQDALYFAWPSSQKTWSNCRQELLADFAKMLLQIQNHTPIKLLCSTSFQDEAQDYLRGAQNISFLDIATDDVWCRDFGPIFVENKGQKEIINWQFNAWGEKFSDYAQDNLANIKIAEIAKTPYTSLPYILEGGSIDVNGTGFGLTTSSVVFNKNRHQDPEQLTKKIKEYLGLHTLIILNNGLINDDTDGHIDNLARFYKKDGIIASTCANNNPNFRQLQKNLKQLQKLPFHIIELPLPNPIFDNGKILPASYANFLISNEIVFIPHFNQKDNDTQATQIIQKCFPDKQILGIDCSTFIKEGGSIHCLSQQEVKI